MSDPVVFSDSKMPPEEEYDLLVEAGKLPETNVVLPKSYLSVSQVHLFQNCSRAYYWRYIQDVVVPPQARQAEGSAVHKSLERAHRDCLKSGQVTSLDIMLDAHNDAWKTLKPEIEVWDEDEDEERILKRGRSFLTQYHAKYLPKLKPVLIEKRFWISMGSKNVPLTGYIDLVADDLTDPAFTVSTVVDYKVVSKAKSQAAIDTDIQLTVYSHAAGVPRVRFDQFVKTTAPAVKILQSVRNVKSYLWVQGMFQMIAESIGAGIFPPCDPGHWMCTEKWCGYWKRCRGK